jgi:hypothetical protein
MTKVYVLLVETPLGYAYAVGDNMWMDKIVDMYTSREAAELAGETLKDPGRFWRIEEWNVP